MVCFELLISSWRKIKLSCIEISISCLNWFKHFYNFFFAYFNFILNYRLLMHSLLFILPTWKDSFRSPHTLYPTPPKILNTTLNSHPISYLILKSKLKEEKMLFLPQNKSLLLQTELEVGLTQELILDSTLKGL